MRELIRALWVWAALPAGTPALRDFLAVVTAAQGVVRVIDGRLFVMPETWLAPQSVYGVTQALVAVWLLVSRGRRATTVARLAAAMAAGVYVALAWDAMARNAVSGITALLFAWTLAIEARYAVADC